MPDLNDVIPKKTSVSGSVSNDSLSANVKGVGSLSVSSSSKTVYAAKDRVDPDVAFSFYVEIDGIQCVKFTEFDGIEWKMETLSFYEGGNYRSKVNLLGPTSYSPLTLKKGFFSTGSEFFVWFKRLLDPGTPVNRVTVSLVIQDRKTNEIARYNFYNAFMSKYNGPGMQAKSSEIAFETIEITYDYFEFQPTGSKK